MQTSQTSRKNLAINLGAGILAGAAATYVMGKTMPYLQKLQPEEDKKKEKEVSGEGSVIKTAKMLERWFNLALDQQQLGKLATGIHRGYGLGWGAVFGLAHRYAPGVTKWAGLPFGIAFYAIADQAIPPLFGVAPPPTKFPLSMHIRDFAGHMVYTFTADAVYHALADTPQAVRSIAEERVAA